MKTLVRALAAALCCSLLASAAPRIDAGGVVNGASFAAAPAPVAPGSIISVFGSELASATSVAPSISLPTAIGGVQVFINGVAAPLFFVSPGQINAQVPWEIGSAGELRVVVVVNGTPSNTLTVNAANSAPGCFTMNPAGQGAILIAGTNILAGPPGSVPGYTSRPALPGEYLSLYCTGLGSVTNPPASGSPALVSPLSSTLVMPTATLGGVPARVIFSGLAPGLTGVNQINVQVPEQAPSGDAVPVALSAGSAQGNIVNVAIRRGGGGGQGAIAVTSVSATAAMPLTPLTLATSGLSAGAAVQVRFFNGAGFSVSMKALRVAADGTVVAAVPVYVDPATKQIAAGTVSLVLTQGGLSTDPVTIEIQKLPAPSDYGVRLGEISDAVLVYQAIMVGQRLNQLQAYQALPGASTDTANLRSMLSTVLTAISRARIDVNRVAADNSLVIPNGNLPDGTPIQFDRGALDLMDRVNAVLLTQTFGSLSPSSFVSPRGNGSGQPASDGPLVPLVEFQTAAGLPPSAGSGFSLRDLIALMKTVSGANQVSEASFKGLNPRNNWAQNVEAVGTALSAYFEMVPGDKAKTLGPLAAIASNVFTIGQGFGNFAALIRGMVTGDDALTKVAYDGLQASQADLVSAGIDMVLLLTGGVARLATISTVAGFIKSFFNMGAANYAVQEAVSQKVASYLRGIPPAGTFGVASGSTPLPVESQLNSPQAGIEVCCFTASRSTLTSISDPSGRYTVWIPLQAAGTDYQRLLLRALSLLGGGEVASGTQDMRGLRPDAPLTLSPLTPGGASGMSAVYEGTYSLAVTQSAQCLRAPEPVMIPVVMSTSGAKITLVASAALETVPPGGSAALAGWLLPQGVLSMTFSCDGTLVGVDALPFACAANGAFAGTSNGASVALTMQTSSAGCPDHIIPGTISVVGSKPVVNLSASYTQLTLFGRPAQVVFSATLTKK